MEQDRPGGDRYPEAEQEGVDRDGAERADERLVQAGNAYALSAEQEPLISGGHHALSRSALSADLP